MSNRRLAQLILVGVVLACVAWIAGFLLKDHNPVLLVLTGAAYVAGLLAVWQPWQRRQEERRMTEEERAAAREVQRRLQLVIDGNNDGIWDWDLSDESTESVFWSDRAEQLLGLEQGGLGGSFDVFRSMLLPEDRDEFNKALRRHLMFNEAFDLELRARTGAADDGEGELRHFRICGKAKRDESNRPVRMAGSLADITDRKAKEEELFRSANRDALTGLPNRAWFLNRLVELDRLSRDRTDDVYALMIVNVDHFKQINDNLGPLVADAILAECGRRLRTVVPDEGDLARLGFDEFVVVVRHIRESGDAQTAAKRIQEELSRPYRMESRDVYLTVSLGIVFSGERRERPELILQDATTVLNQSKEMGDGRIQVFTPGMREKERRRYRMMRDLRTALDENQFYLCYQPQIRLKDRSLGGFEALLRWRRPETGDVPPTSFVPVLEETGEILRVGEWVLRRACEQAKLWTEDGHPDLVMSVNVSAPQFTHSDVAETVERTLRATGLEARHLRVELTESVAMSEVERVIDAMNRLRRMGVEVSIDDFGTGYSSLSYLKRYPINELKIDQSFVADLPNPDCKAIIETIVSMARSLKLEIVAEGVETEQQLEYLEARGVDLVQGFYFGVPMRPADVEQRVLRKWKAASRDVA